MLNFENPFADYGNIVRGERFIGRKDGLKAIENRVIRPKESGNIAILGDYRIGKSSLIYKSVMERKNELLNAKQIPIWINLATFDQSSIFFRSLVTCCYEEIEDLNLLNDNIKKAATRALQDEYSWTEGYGRIQRFFEKVRISGLRILFIIDEFDHARFLFKGDISAFQGLRELSYRPEWRVTFITASRRTLRDIELQTKAISTFDLIFHKHYLGMFTDTDFEDYLNRMASIEIEITSTIKDRIDFYCGGHPYLLEMLGYEIMEFFRDNKEIDVDRSAQRIEHSFLGQYDHMVEILNEDNKLTKLLQILFGPVVDVNQADVDEFIRYGLIKLSESDKYSAFSAHFETYLKLIARKIDLWPIWKEAELALRRLVTAKMTEMYGENWVDKLLKARPHLSNIFKKCKAAQQKEQMSFGSRASHNLIDFTYPKDLFDIISTEWNSFKSILGKDKNYWNQRASLLAKIRNPLAHNRDEALDEYERRIAEGFCMEITSILNDYR